MTACCDGLKRGFAQTATRGDVTQNAFGADLAVFQFLHCAREGRLIDVGDHDFHAFATKGLGHAKTQPTRPTRNERYFIAKVFH